MYACTVQSKIPRYFQTAKSSRTFQHTHTHTHLMALFQWLPRLAGTRKVKPIWILLKQETVSGGGISWAICKSAPRCRQITMPAPHHSVFLQAGCPSCHPNNSVKALKARTFQQQPQKINMQVCRNLHHLTPHNCKFYNRPKLTDHCEARRMKVHYSVPVSWTLKYTCPGTNSGTSTFRLENVFGAVPSMAQRSGVMRGRSHIWSAEISTTSLSSIACNPESR